MQSCPSLARKICANCDDRTHDIYPSSCTSTGESSTQEMLRWWTIMLMANGAWGRIPLPPCSQQGGALSPGESQCSHCIGEYVPVCGSDRNTYNNQCLLECQRELLLHERLCLFCSPLFSSFFEEKLLPVQMRSNLPENDGKMADRMRSRSDSVVNISSLIFSH